MPKSKRPRLKKNKKLEVRISQLESDLRKSVSKIQLQSLQKQIDNVQKKIAESVPRSRLDATKKDLRAKILELDLKLKQSGKDAELLRSRIAQMQVKASQSPVIGKTMENLTKTQLQLKNEVQRLKEQLTHSTTPDALHGLERKLTELTAHVQDRIVQLQSDVTSSLAGSASRSSHSTMDQLHSKIVELESKLAAAVPKSEVDELKSRINQLEEELKAAARRIKALEPQRETESS